MTQTHCTNCGSATRNKNMRLDTMFETWNNMHSNDLYDENPKSEPAWLDRKAWDFSPISHE